MNVVISALTDKPAWAQPVEVVERKGLGHPDTLCDALAEEVGLALSRFYRDRFGFVLHYNVDKVLLRAGTARSAFGGGTVEDPMDLYVAGRATNEYRGVKIPVEDLTVGACRSWLAAHMHALDASRHARVHCLLRPGSADLVDLFARQCQGAPRLANDTSMGAGFAPATPLELAVLGAERCLRSFEAPECGEDVKVMGVRTGEHVSLTVACAFVDAHLRTLDAYLSARDRAALQVRSAAAEILGAEPAVEVNAADDPSAGSLYLTVTGTSAEAGDDGQTGRGNRLNGLITPSRPMVIESFAGKNPVSHVGKLYNVAAQRVAEALISDLADIEEAHVLLVARIGAPVDRPQVVHIRLRGKDVDSDVRFAPRAREITKSHLDRIDSLSELLLASNLVTDRLPVL